MRPAVPPLQRAETQLAGVAAEDDPSRNRDCLSRLVAGLEVGEAFANLSDRGGDRDTHRIGAARGIRSLCQQPLALGQPHRLLLEDVLVGCFGGGVRGHGGRGVGHEGSSLKIVAQSIREAIVTPRARKLWTQSAGGRMSSTPASTSAWSTVVCMSAAR